MIPRRWRYVCVGLVLVIAVSCGDSGGTSPTTPSPTPASTTFQATIAGVNGQLGTLSVTVQAQVAATSRSIFWPLVATLDAQSVSASGSVHVAGGATTALTGTYDSTSKALSLSGGGFTFTGSSSGAVLSGTYASSGTTGTFAGRSTASGSVTIYCGNNFSRGDTNQATGVFSFALSDASGALSGTFNIFADSPPTLGSITGQVTGTSISFTFNATAGRFAGETGTVTGTIQGGAFNGTSNTGNRVAGSVSQCQ